MEPAAYNMHTSMDHSSEWQHWFETVITSLSQAELQLILPHLLTHLAPQLFCQLLYMRSQLASSFTASSWINASCSLFTD